MAYLTEQENFWAGEFGDNYIKRNSAAESITIKTFFWTRVLKRTVGINSCLEIGSNIGLNLLALGGLFPGIKMQAVEINEKAAMECKKIPNVNVFTGSALDYEVENAAYDLTFTCGVLIHINPDTLPVIYNKLYMGARRYIVVAEYYNPTPVEVCYRGNSGKLFKRDFAGELIDKYPDLRLIDYGFFYHRDTDCPCDDIRWFLMEKR